MTIHFADRCAIGFIVLGLALLSQTLTRADEDNCGTNCNEIKCWVTDFNPDEKCYGYEISSCAPCEYGRCRLVVTTTPKCDDVKDSQMTRYYYGKNVCTKLCNLKADSLAEASPAGEPTNDGKVYRKQCGPVIPPGGG